MERYTLDDHLELVRECLAKFEDYDVRDTELLRTDVELVVYRLKTLEARLDGGSAERRRKDRQRRRIVDTLTGEALPFGDY